MRWSAASEAPSAVPDGEYHGEVIDDDGIGQEPVRVKAKLTVVGDGIEVNFAGSDSQVKTNMNNPFASTEAAAIACLKSATDPDVINDGSTWAIKVMAPIGQRSSTRRPSPGPRAPSAATASSMRLRWRWKWCRNG